ncbi:SCAN domain-containing protein 3 [Trichonephila clavipes]|nr:SCAN domain-containing protein 3 [Trichonephila clavipes]
MFRRSIARFGFCAIKSHIHSFKAKIELWGRRVSRGIFDMFQPLAGTLGETEPGHSFSQSVHDHLFFILKDISCAASQLQKTHELVRDGSTTHLSTNRVNVACLCKKINCWRLQMTAFEATTLPVFRNKVMTEYLEMATTALKALLPFLTTYLCEAGFFAVTATKTKQRNKLDISDTLRASFFFVSDYPQMEPPHCNETSSGFSLI